MQSIFFEQPEPRGKRCLFCFKTATRRHFNHEIHEFEQLCEFHYGPLAGTESGNIIVVRLFSTLSSGELYRKSYSALLVSRPDLSRDIARRFREEGASEAQIELAYFRAGTLLLLQSKRAGISSSQGKDGLELNIFLRSCGHCQSCQLQVSVGDLNVCSGCGLIKKNEVCP